MSSLKKKLRLIGCEETSNKADVIDTFRFWTQLFGNIRCLLPKYSGCRFIVKLSSLNVEKKHTTGVSAKFVFFMRHHCHRASSIRILFAAAAAACCFRWRRRCCRLCLATVAMFGRMYLFCCKMVIFDIHIHEYNIHTLCISSKTTHLNIYIYNSDIFSNLPFYSDLRRNKQSTREKRREIIDNEKKRRQLGSSCNKEKQFPNMFFYSIFLAHFFIRRQPPPSSHTLFHFELSE